MRRSTMGRKSSSASSMTTSAPSRFQTLPELQADHAGADYAQARRHRIELQGAGGIDDGTRHPVALAGCPPAASRAPRSHASLRAFAGASPCGVYSTRWCAASLPWPANAVTPLPWNSAPMPPVSCATTASLRAIMRGTSTVTSPVEMPNPASFSLASTNLWEASSNALEGMQPQFKQGAAIGWRAILAARLVDAGHFHAELRGANGRRVAGRPAPTTMTS